MLARFLSPNAERAYALLRIVAGFMFACHGAQKLFGFLAEGPPHEMNFQMKLGGWIELVCGALILVGLLTRWAAFLASGEMAVAYVQFHWKLQFDADVFPIANKGELALVYAFVFLYIACRGSGPWSVGRACCAGTPAPEPPSVA